MAIRRITFPGAMWLASLVYSIINTDVDVDILRFTTNGNYNTETVITIDPDATTSRSVKSIDVWVEFDVNEQQPATYIDFYRTDEAVPAGDTDRIGQMSYIAQGGQISWDNTSYSTTALKALIRTYTNAALDVYFAITYYKEQ